MRLYRGVFSLLCLGLVLAASGCGGPSPEDVVRDFNRLYAGLDPAAADYITGPLQDKFRARMAEAAEQAEDRRIDLSGLKCETMGKDQSTARVRVRGKARIITPRGEVTRPIEMTMDLVKTETGWLIEGRSLFGGGLIKLMDDLE